jgi:hypothetical protein
MLGLTGGILTAKRQTVPCPRCGSPALPDCDQLGQSVALCTCSRSPILLRWWPHEKGPPIPPWSIDLSACGPEPDDPPPPRRRAFVPRRNDARRCPGVDGVSCPRAIKGRSLFCAECAPIMAAKRQPCPGIEGDTAPCPHGRKYNAKRCFSCAKRWNAIRRARCSERHVREARERRQARRDAIARLAAVAE